MKKKYIAPQTEVLTIQTSSTLLAASGPYDYEGTSDIYSSEADLARSHNYVWDDDEE